MYMRTSEEQAAREVGGGWGEQSHTGKSEGGGELNSVTKKLCVSDGKHSSPKIC